MRRTYLESQSISSAATGTFTIGGESDKIRAQVRGAGSGSVQILIAGDTDHEAYVISDTAIDINVSSVDEVQVTASGGDIECTIIAFRG